jgi:hypothetical protein
MTPEHMHEAVQDVIERRIAREETKGNAAGAKKWRVELRHLTQEGNVRALAQMGFDPARLENLAIYATTKVRRMTAHLTGDGRVDPYTEVLLKNALAVAKDGEVPNGLMLASLTTHRKSAETLPQRRAGKEGTASTQACSTRAALVALGVGQVIGRSFRIEFNHPVVTAITGGAAKER